MSKALAISPQVSFPASLQADLTDMYTDFANHGSLDEAESLGEFTLSKAGHFFCQVSALPAQIEAAMERLVIPPRP
jgi:hypothetical protein